MFLQMQAVPGTEFVAHLTHLWYGPPLLLAALPVIKRFVRYKRTQWATLGEMVDTLSPEARALAEHLTTSQIAAGLLTFLRHHPTTALTTADLACHVGRDLPAVEETLMQLAASGLAEVECTCGLTFYWLTRDSGRQARLDELVA
jgi:hypothetical protein